MLGVVVVADQEVILTGLTAMVADVAEVSHWRGMHAIDDTVGWVDDDTATDMVVMTLSVRERLGDDIGVFCGLPTLLVVPNGDTEVMELAARMEADGYVMMTDLTTTTLRTALLDLSEARLRLPPAMATHLLARARDDTPSASYSYIHVSPRERDVLDLLLVGLSNKEIASDLGLSIHGVKRHVSNILGKYCSPSRSHLVATLLRSTTTTTSFSAPGYSTRI